MDGVYLYLSQSIDQQLLASIIGKLREEEYDTETLETDILWFTRDVSCNLTELVQDKECFAAICDFVYDQKRMLHTVSWTND